MVAAYQALHNPDSRHYADNFMEQAITIDHDGNDQDYGDDEDDEEHEEGDSDDDEDAQYSDEGVFSEFKWLEPISVTVTSSATLDERGKPRVVAMCRAKLIRRNMICGDFYDEMEQPTEETSMLAFDLFDRYGRLRSEFTIHPVIRGTGIFGQELGRGDMLLIEEIFVTQEHRRQQLGRRMVELLLNLVKQKTSSFFAFTWPSILKRSDIGKEWDSLQDDAARRRMAHRETGRAVDFWRSSGFRRVGTTDWFALTLDNDHPSRQLTSTDDFEPPEVPLTALDDLLSPFQQIGDAAVSAQDHTPDYLGVLHDCMQQKGPGDACWTSKDKDGNNVLHLAASASDIKCVEWIMAQDFGTKLLQARNNRGETPFERLQFKLEVLRTRKSVNLLTLSISDRFNGHSDSAVHCLVLLQGLGSLESLLGTATIMQMAGGCSCGQCVGGFLSPRMSHALQCEAEMANDDLDEQIAECAGPEWVEFNTPHLAYLPSRVRDNLETNKSMRQGFVNLCRHIAICLQEAQPPTVANVMAAAHAAREWPPFTRNYLERGGTVEAVFLGICREAIGRDECTGDGEHMEVFGEAIAMLPECRNDHEFGYVSGMCGYRRISQRPHVSMMGERLDENGNRIDSLL
jgi:GNAT superfamily N-acetyltransferase